MAFAPKEKNRKIEKMLKSEDEALLRTNKLSDMFASRRNRIYDSRSIRVASAPQRLVLWCSGDTIASSFQLHFTIHSYLQLLSSIKFTSRDAPSFTSRVEGILYNIIEWVVRLVICPNQIILPHLFHVICLYDLKR